MQIYDKPLGWLTPYENNPRNNDEAVEPVANSISEFGFKVPIVATSDGEIINGHTRWKAAKKLKLKTVPVIIADDLTEEQVRAFRLADNKVAEIAQWDIELLLSESEDEIESEGDSVSSVEYGDIYQLGRHRLMCGDSTSAGDMKELDPVYVERTIKRWEEETGLKAEKIN